MGRPSRRSDLLAQARAIARRPVGHRAGRAGAGDHRQRAAGPCGAARHLARGRRGGAGPRQCGGVRLRRDPAGNGRALSRRPRADRKHLHRSHRRRATSLRDAALVIFTSGSTGKPKGVVIGHERMAGKLAVLDRLLRPRPRKTRIVVPLRLTFIFGIWVSLLAVRSGARLVLVSKFTPEGVAKPLARRRHRAGGRADHAEEHAGRRRHRRAGPAHDPHRRRDAGRGARRQLAGGAAAGGRLRPLRPDRDGLVRLLPAAGRACSTAPAPSAGRPSRWPFACSARMAGPCPTAPRASSRSARRSACWAISTIPALTGGLLQRRLLAHRRPGAAAARRPGRDRRPPQGHHLARRQQDRAGRDRRPALLPPRRGGGPVRRRPRSPARRGDPRRRRAQGQRRR